VITTVREIQRPGWELGTKIMKSGEISKSTKLKICRTIIRPIVVYGCEGWTMSEHMEEAVKSLGKKDFKEGIRPKRDTNG
jgi:hypothetical protein